MLGQEWKGISAGLVQRLTALNLFIVDLCGSARVVTDGGLPEEVLAPNRLRELVAMLTCGR